MSESPEDFRAKGYRPSHEYDSATNRRDRENREHVYIEPHDVKDPLEDEGTGIVWTFAVFYATDMWRNRFLSGYSIEVSSPKTRKAYMRIQAYGSFYDPDATFNARSNSEGPHDEFVFKSPEMQAEDIARRILNLDERIKEVLC